MAHKKALVFMVCVLGWVASLTASSPLKFNNNGQFKILQVADMHYADGKSTKCEDVLPSQYPTCSDLNTTVFVNRMIQAEKPDLIVFTGDNIYGADATNGAASLRAAFEPAIAAKIPWAAVLGNHDQESALTREEVMKHIVPMNYTLSKLNPVDIHEKIDGFGNYNLEVFGIADSELKDKSVLNLYFVDSGDYSSVPNIAGYDWIKPSQQSWFKNISAKLQKNYRSSPPAQRESAPGLVYFHIPLPEVNELSSSNMTGIKQEPISCASYNSGFLKSMVEAGDVKAAFTGHDHVNDFCGKVNGIELCYAGGFGYHAYGQAGWARRSRVVVASLEKDGKGGWKGVENIITWKRLDDKSLSRIDIQTLWSKSSKSSHDPAFLLLTAKTGLCWDLECDAFVLEKNSVIGPTSVFNDISTYNGDQKDYTISIIRERATRPDGETVWAVWLGGSRVGYYPLTLFQDAFNPTDMLFGGEVTSYSAGKGSTHTKPGMGSGRFAESGFGQAAYISRMELFDDSSINIQDFSVYVKQINPDCYNTRVVKDEKPGWGTSIYFGGVNVL